MFDVKQGQTEDNTPKVAWHAMAVEQALSSLESQETGLSKDEVERRRQQYGLNALPEPPKHSLIYRFFLQCHNVLIYVLLVAAIVTLLLQHWVDSGVILGVVLINAVIGLIQEGKAESAILALRNLLSSQASIIRDGTRHQIPAEELVPGDIVFVQAGDKVPADLRMIHAKSLYIQEAALTGESVPVEKDTQALAENTLLADRQCMAFSSTLVTYGQGVGVVVATSMQTEIGRISSLLSQVGTITTPLLKQLTQFGHFLSAVIIGVAAVTMVLGVWAHGFAWSEMFIAAVGLAVAAIPEGLPAVMTIMLAIGVQKMAARHAIIRRLPAVETLGSTTVICSDKTGTLTCNEMTVTKVISTANGEFTLSGEGYDPHGSFEQAGQQMDVESLPGLTEISRVVLLCNDAHIRSENGAWQLVGDPTEGALVVLAMKAGLEAETERQLWTQLDNIPFESQHQFMASLHHDHQGHYQCFVKGAPEKVLQMCGQQRSEQGVQALQVDFWLQQMAQLAEQGLRVLAVACKDMPADKIDLSFDDVKTDMTLLGLVAMIDPPREEATQALKQCHSAGIAVKMITGDHKVTADAIAKQMGLKRGEQVVDGQQLESLNDVELQQLVKNSNVFARATPEHKLRLVKALQANGQVVAMTGDGVNDAPALKRADVGIAMGINGTEVAKDAAEMVLANDNFASIVDAVEEGRTVYDNLTKAVLFLLPTNAGEALIIMAAIIFGVMLPITPVQILWVNMITAVTLGLALAFEPGESDLMQRQPRQTDAPLLSKPLVWRVIFVGMVIMLGSFGLFIWEVQQGSELEYARTVAVNTLVMFEVFYLFNARYISASVLNFEGLFGNRYVLLAVAILMVFQLTYTYLPTMQLLFGSTALTLETWIEIICVASTVFWLVELEKWGIRLYHKQNG